MRSLKLSTLAALLMVGCGSAPPLAELGTTSRQAIAADNRGYTQFSHGDYVAAATAFAEALRHEQAIDNDEGIAIQLLNLSITFQRMGKLQEAEEMVDRLLRNADYRQFTPQRLVEARLRKSILLIDRGHPEEAEPLIAEAENQMPVGQPTLMAKAANVRAEIDLRSGKPELAKTQAEAALAQAKIAKDQEETANALRNLGAALLQLHAPEAETTLTQALQLDKTLELPRKIARDLLLLSKAVRSEADKSGYLKRALETAEATGDEKTLAEVQLALQQVTGSK